MQTLQQLKAGMLKGAVSLKLSEGITYFPSEILELEDTLEVLDLTKNKLSELPADFGRLKKLKIFFCSDNLFTELPAVLGDCPALDMVGFKANKITTIHPKALNVHLRWLILTDNFITELPQEIGQCARMKKLMLAGNRLHELPVALRNCSNLSLLRISANRLSELPPWLLSMPRLSWLAFSGNQFNKKTENITLPAIDWQELHILNVLGEGASGIIYKGEKRSNNVIEDVAVKVFKGAVTSDGLPDDEMNTCIAAGSHHGLVKVLGQINNHPEGKQGLVMSLIAPRFFNLGLAPSFESCTRDVFKTDFTLTVAQALKIACTIASVASQLHSKGIMHGDLYAHNTLIDKEGNTLFGDFGAACFYDKSDATIALRLERIEVSAFGYLLDDLTQLCKDDKKAPAFSTLAILRDAAISPSVLARPGFDYLSRELDNAAKHFIT